jgi:hypothetical protein
MVRYGEPFRHQPWQRFYIKDSTLRPVVWEAKAAPVYLKRDGLPTWPHWLIVARNVLAAASEVKYLVSTRNATLSVGNVSVRPDPNLVIPKSPVRLLPFQQGKNVLDSRLPHLRWGLEVRTVGTWLMMPEGAE